MISEDETNDPSAALYREHLFCFRNADLIDGILGLYKNPEYFRQEAAKRLTAFRQCSARSTIGAALENHLHSTTQ